MAQHLLHMMDRPALFEPPAAGLVSEIVKVQIDVVKLRAGGGRQGAAADPFRFVSVRAEHRRVPRLG